MSRVPKDRSCHGSVRVSTDVGRLLLDNMLSNSGKMEHSMTIRQQKHWFRIWMLAALMIGAAIAVMYAIPENRFASAGADALLIAGVLALGVDPLLKRDLLTEASRGVFFHILGFDHHPQVKEKLKEIVYGTKLLRTKLHTTINVEPQDDGFLVRVEYESEILNSTNLPVTYEPSIDWDMAHKPQVLWMSFTSSDGKVKWTEKNPALEESEPGVQKISPHKVTLQPHMKSGTTYRGSGSFTIFTKHGYFILYTGLPTLQTSNRAFVPEDYEVSGTKADVENENYWEWNSIRMPGYHTSIRWRKRGGDWL